MLFNSLSFIIFVICVTLIYYILPRFIRYEGTQRLVLIFSGLFFYAYNRLYYAVCLLAVALLNGACFFAARRLIIAGRAKAARFIIAGGICIDVLILFFFKYSGVLFPLGISFYIFHAISMLADSVNKERGIADAPVRLTDILCYMTFFPNSVSGPITRFKDFLPQPGRHSFKEADKRKAFEYLLLGYFFKAAVADNIQNYTTYLGETDFTGLSPLRILFQMFGYSCQIFADFAGYSYIAIGLGLLLCIRLPQNFNFPYISQSLTEFWRRWHMSLSGWLKEYIYIPLGGNRKGTLRTCINLMAVMLIGGIWHGSEWKYFIWGALHGLLLVTERMLSRASGQKKSSSVPAKALRTFITFFIVSWLWLFFKMKDPGAVIRITRQMLTGWSSIRDVDPKEILMLCFYMCPVFMLHLIYKLARTLPPCRPTRART